MKIIFQWGKEICEIFGKSDWILVSIMAGIILFLSVATLVANRWAKKHGFPNENRKGGTEMKKLLIILIALVATLFFTSLTMARDRGGGHRGNYPGGGRLNNDHGFRGGGNFDRGSIDRGHFRGGYDHFRGGHYPGYYGGYYGGWSGWDDYGYYGNYGYWVPGYWIRQWDPYYGRWVRIWIPGYWR